MDTGRRHRQHGDARQPGPQEPGPQQAVARARANVLGGRGPGAEKAETDRYKRERPTLGALPAPLERELVHLAAMRMRSGRQQHVDPTSIRNQEDRLRELWAAKPPDHPRSRALRSALGMDARNASGREPAACRRARATVLGTATVGAAATFRRVRALFGCRSGIR